MSRSRKKEAVFKDPNNSKGKMFSNRKFRRKIKEAIHRQSETMPLIDEVMNAYDVVDFKIRGHRDDDEFYEQLKRK